MATVDRESYDGALLAGRVEHFLELRQAQRQIKDRLDEIRDELADVVERHGYEDDKGHIVLDLPKPIDGMTKLVRQRRVTQTLNEQRAEALLKERGLWDRCSYIVQHIDEDEVAAVVFESSVLSREELDDLIEAGTGYLTTAEFDRLIDRHVSYVGPIPSK